MKVLSGDQLNTAETVLKASFPQSLQVYGHIFLMNRMKSDPVDVLVDSWPDFTIVVCRPQNKEEGDRLKTIYTFSKDEAALRKMLGQKDLLPWQEFFFIGVDQCFELAVRSAAEARAGVSAEKYAMARQMRLHDLSQLPVLDRMKPCSGCLGYLVAGFCDITVLLPSCILFQSAIQAESSLGSESHLDLVKGTWKFSEARTRQE
ncbi:hypothetical protein GJAV_G00243960 [Gymnothorax javanicus]|nr:hypothetical protein GJAV_G00243960 [Gymnothorax javanicus]